MSSYEWIKKDNDWKGHWCGCKRGAYSGIYQYVVQQTAGPDGKSHFGDIFAVEAHHKDLLQLSMVSWDNITLVKSPLTSRGMDGLVLAIILYIHRGYWPRRPESSARFDVSFQYDNVSVFTTIIAVRELWCRALTNPLIRGPVIQNSEAHAAFFSLPTFQNRVWEMWRKSFERSLRRWSQTWRYWVDPYWRAANSTAASHCRECCLCL